MILLNIAQQYPGVGKYCGIVNCRCSAYSSGTARIKSSCNVTGKCFGIGY